MNPYIPAALALAMAAWSTRQPRGQRARSDLVRARNTVVGRLYKLDTLWDQGQPFALKRVRTPKNRRKLLKKQTKAGVRREINHVNAMLADADGILFEQVGRKASKKPRYAVVPSATRMVEIGTRVDDDPWFDRVEKRHDQATSREAAKAALKRQTQQIRDDANAPVLRYKGPVPEGHDVRTAVSPHTGIKFEYVRKTGKAGRPPVYANQSERELMEGTAKASTALREMYLIGAELPDHYRSEWAAHIRNSVIAQTVYDPTTNKQYKSYNQWGKEMKAQRKAAAKKRRAG